MYFPDTFPADDSYNFYKNIKQQTLLLARVLLQESPSIEDTEELNRLRLELVTSNKPQNFRPEDAENVMILYDKSFASLVALAEKNGATNPGALSCFDFYARIDFLRKSLSKK